IRELANAYTLNIYDSEDIYEFFDFTTEPFTPWQQLEYFQLITNRPLAPKADFGKWINPKYENSIISLSLDLVAYYHQETAIEPIHSMIKIDHTKMRRKMIRTLGILNQKQSIDVLMDLYIEEDDMKCKTEIIKSLGYMGYKNEKVIHFLDELLKTEFHTNFRKAILIALSRATGSESILENKIYRYELEKTVPDEQKIL
ncbi:HEAT repeat domain-containing protein, partial [Flavobacterium sp.]|uniref:HEAT repeat domain-containing protein n=1 Tax=Flavobacterium sp. TaxID=239 RepID=UPI0035B24E0D